MVLGAASNVIIRDGGIPGVVVRLGRSFSEITAEPDHRVRVGTGVLDVRVARAARDAGIAGLEFLSDIPGGIGGALRMNAGAYGGETKDILVEARGVDRRGNLRTFSNADMGYRTATPTRRTTSSSPRRCSRAGSAIRRRSAPR